MIVSPSLAGAIARECDEIQKLLGDMAVDPDMDQRKPSGRPATGLDGGNSRFVTVGTPTPYEGVGRALRATYAPVRENLPQDMLALLANLDRH